LKWRNRRPNKKLDIKKMIHMKGAGTYQLRMQKFDLDPGTVFDGIHEIERQLADLRQEPEAKESVEAIEIIEANIELAAKLNEVAL
jgi:hypothetical protein